MDNISMDKFLSEVAVLSKTIKIIDKKLDISNSADKVTRSLELYESNITMEFAKLQRQNAKIIQEQKDSNDKVKKGINVLNKSTQVPQLGASTNSENLKTGVLTKLKGQFSNLTNSIKSSKLSFSALKGSITKGFSKIGLFMTAIKSGTQTLLKKLPWILMIGAVILALLKKAWDWLTELPLKLWNTAVDWFKGTFKSIKSFFTGKDTSSESDDTTVDTNKPVETTTAVDTNKPVETTTALSDIPEVQSTHLEEQSLSDAQVFPNSLSSMSSLTPELPGSIEGLPQVESAQVITDNSVTNVHNITVNNHSSKTPYS